MLGVASLLAAQCTPVRAVHAPPDSETPRDAQVPATNATDAPSSAPPLAASCGSDLDCPTPDACAEVRCERAICVTSAKPDGSVLADAQQLPSDCRRIVCDGRGRERLENDDSDAASSDGNPCHEVICQTGKVKVSNVSDGMVCNDTGTCKAGACSVCSEGADCSRPTDCTVYQIRCIQGDPLCTDTQIPRANQACDMGRMCNEGTCMRSCQDGACMPSSDLCQTSRWDCSDPSVPPICVPVPSPDGIACASDSHCHAGACSHSSLVNGDFSRGLEGWTPTGDAARFPIGPDDNHFQRIAISTSLDGGHGGASARGSLAQMFVVPADALALRFTVFGGHAHVRLRDANGGGLEDCTGIDSDARRIPVSWDLQGHRGETLTIAIEDDLVTGDWAFISASGFDVVRDIDGPIHNSQFAYDMASWDTTEDGAHFNIFDDYNYGMPGAGDDSYGYRRSVSTYGRLGGNLYDASKGTMSQTFLVPIDAVALRFNVHGGMNARVSLLESTTSLYSIVANNDDTRKVLASWDMQPYRGKTVRVVIEDATINPPFGYIGSSGFDLITSYNGP
jgi:hypothetical protein